MHLDVTKAGALSSADRARAAAIPAPLVDRLGRVHRALRISVTDACNIRCRYCMPESNVQFLPRSELLSPEQIERFVRQAASWGLTSIRLTGGEPLLRPELEEIIERLAGVPLVQDLALTTNGMLLAERIDGLVQAGLERINISLDTLDADVFERISRRQGLERVLAGIDAAMACSAVRVKLNALVLRDVNESGMLELVEFALQRNLPLRFIEFMPLDADRVWSHRQVVTGAELRLRIAEHLGELEPVARTDPSRPATEYRVAGYEATVGFIDTVSNPFCHACDRVRLTADGKLRNCLFGQEEWNVAPWLQDDAHRDRVESALRECVWAKHPAHGIDDPNFVPPERAMYQIGG